MKGKKLFIFVATIFMTVFMLPTMVFAASSTCKPGTEFQSVELISGGESEKYKFVDKALEAAKEGDTIKFLMSADDHCFETFETNGRININKSLTVDLNNQEFLNDFMVSNGATVTFKGNAQENSKSSTSFPFFYVADNSTAIFDGGTYDKSFAPPLFEVGSNAHLILKNITVPSEGKSEVGNIVKLSDNSTVRIENSTIKASSKVFQIYGNHNIVTVSSGSLSGGYGITQFDTQASNNTFNFENNASINSEVKIEGNHNTVNVKDAKHKIVTYDYAIYVLGTNNTYNVSGNSVLEAKYGAIYTNSETAVVNIDGGTLKTVKEEENGRLTPVILAEKVKELNINDGTIIGQVGVVALSGSVNINGGAINATNDDNTKKLVYSKASNGSPIFHLEDGDNFYGAAVIATGSGTKVNIIGGEINAATEESIVGENGANYAVSGGIYNKPFDSKFVVPDKLELTLTMDEEQNWYVGQDAVDAVEKSKNDSSNKIEILQGDITIEDAAEGLRVKNSGNGSVKVNEVTVETNQTVNAPNTGDVVTPKNPQTGDGIITYIIMGILGLLGLAGITTKRLILNKR